MSVELDVREALSRAKTSSLGRCNRILSANEVYQYLPIAYKYQSRGPNLYTSQSPYKPQDVPARDVSRTTPALPLRITPIANCYPQRRRLLSWMSGAMKYHIIS